MKILIIEDDLYTRKLIYEFLTREEMECYEIDNGEEALGAVIKLSPDIIILDINLPGKSGIEICSIIREKPHIYANPIILMLTGETQPDNVRMGFKIGADDYIKKPFDIEELLLRVRAWTKRSHKLDKILKYRDIIIDIDNKRVFEKEEPITVSAKEFEVLRYLIVNRGLVVSREKIMEEVWNIEYSAGCKTVDMTIKRIKEKVNSIESVIEAVSGIGYRLIK